MIKIYDIILKNKAISTEDGKKVFDVLKKEIETNTNTNTNKEIVVSFEGINMIISHFLNVSIGELYIHFDTKWNFLDSIKYVGIEDDLELLSKVIQTYKHDLKKQQSIQSKILND